MVNLKNVIFDFDGTIVDSFMLLGETIGPLSAKYNFKISEEFEAIKNKGLINFLLEDLNLPPSKIEEFSIDLISFIKKKGNQIYKKTTIFTGIFNCLKNLSSKYKVNLLTSNTKKPTELVFTREKIDFLDSMVLDAPLGKKEESLNHFLKKSQLANDEVIYIGDEVSDIKSCKKLGIKIIAVSWGFNSRELLEKEDPDFLVDTPEEIVKILIPT